MSAATPPTPLESLESLLSKLPCAAGAAERAHVGVRGLPDAFSAEESDVRAIVKLLAHRESQGFTWLGFGDDDAVEFDRYEDYLEARDANGSDEVTDLKDPNDFRELFTAYRHKQHWDLLDRICDSCHTSCPSYMVDFAADIPANAEFVLDRKNMRLMFARAADNEKRLWIAIHGRASTPVGPLSPATTGILDSLFPPQKPGTVEAESQAEQIAAAKLIVGRAMSVLTGPPGTGKTHTLVRTALAWLCGEVGNHATDQTYTPRKIYLMAPTGRASSRMGELIAEALGNFESDPAQLSALGPHGPAAIAILRDSKPTTIHRALQYSTKPGMPFRHNREHPLDAGLVIVDETSMLGLELARRLFDALGVDSQICLVGDPGQLRAVEMGSVLYDFVQATRTEPALGACHASLLVSRRFPPGSMIDQLARAINGTTGAASGKSLMEILEANRITLKEIRDEFKAGLPTTGETKTTTVRWLEVSESELASYAHNIVEMQADDLRKHAHDPDVAETLKRSIVLSVHRHGLTGAHWLAKHAVKHLRGSAPGDEFAFPDGSTIMITRNTRALDVANGDLAIVDRRAEPPRALFSKKKFYDLRVLPTPAPAAALTVHKAQGSEWRHVFVVLPADPSPLLTSRLLYTACTRASSLLTVVTTRSTAVMTLTTSQKDNL